MTPDKAELNLIKALGKGVLKIMSKMGVSTVASYTGRADLRGDRPRRGGRRDLLRRDVVAARRRRVRRARRRRPPGGPPSRRAVAGLLHRRLEIGGEYQWRREGEPHLFNPETVFKLQHATRSRRYEIFKEYTSLVDDQATSLKTLRGLLRIRGIDDGGDGAVASPLTPAPPGGGGAGRRAS